MSPARYPRTERVGPFRGPAIGAALLLALALPGSRPATASPVDGTAAADPADWWSLRPLRLPLVPEGVAGGPGPRNPVDAFIFARLAASGLASSPGADRRALIRRVCFDLIGLPPTPGEVEAFVNDPAPDAYERLVDRLLGSPRHGERWARHWMDAAHFAETHGHDQDRIREHAWPYRDYLISSLNADKPYARFVEEQVAGDALYPDDPEAVAALGFLAAGPWDESSLRDIREDTLDREIARYLDRDDMVTTVMQTFASVTVQCARCHDHKFDPVPQRDYYALQAVFAGVDRANRSYDPDPRTHRRRREIEARLSALKSGDRSLLLSAAAEKRTAEWERALAGEDAWRAVLAETFLSAGSATLTRELDGALLAGGARPERDTYTITAASPLPSITAVRIEAMADARLPSRGPGRTDHGNFHLSELRLLVFEQGGTTPREIKLRSPSADFDQEGWTAAHAIDGDAKTAWGIHPREGRTHVAVFELAEKLAPPPGARIVFVLEQVHGGGHVIGRARISLTDVEPASRARALPAEVREALDVPAGSRSPAQRAALAIFREREDLQREHEALGPRRLVYAAASDFSPDGGLRPAGKPRPIHVLKRGEITAPLEEASPGALACVSAIPSRFSIEAGEPEAARRAALARWLTRPENPLVWRSIVNRVWHHHFGRGIVDTPNDFGRMGGAPSHAELLDWLACRFRDGGGSLKDLHRLIVTSTTYRQAASPAAPASKSADPENRLLGRWHPARLDAECVRDAALAIAGRLDLRMGGPSDRQFDLQPGIHVTPRVDYAKFDPDSDAGRRRSVYRFLFRTLPDPMMDALDCPAGDQLTAARAASVTVQGALALWNGAFLNRQCEHIAARLEAMGPGLEGQVDAAVRLILGRPARPEELADLSAYAVRHGLANLCRVLLNSNEFLFVS